MFSIITDAARHSTLNIVKSRETCFTLIQKEDKKIPQEVRGIIEALAEPSRRGIAMIVAENRRKKGGELSFKKLLILVKPMNPSTLNHHLKCLMGSGLVENIYMKKN